jgi:hypothetical protein
MDIPHSSGASKTMKSINKSIPLCAALIAASLSLGLTGCAGISTDVRVTPPVAPLDGEHSYALARSPLQDGNRDHSEYETLIRAELNKYGFADVNQQRAHYLLSIAYDTRPAAVGVDGTPAGDSSFALFGHRYRHSLTLRFFEQTTGHEVYQVSAASQDRDADPLHAIPYLVKSALAQFPYADHPDWRVKLRADSSQDGEGGARVVSVKPVQP